MNDAEEKLKKAIRAMTRELVNEVVNEVLLCLAKHLAVGALALTALLVAAWGLYCCFVEGKVPWSR